jgi:uncharacterized membrane protein YagU involved in acid resistance
MANEKTKRKNKQTNRNTTNYLTNQKLNNSEVIVIFKFSFTFTFLPMFHKRLWNNIRRTISVVSLPTL